MEESLETTAPDTPDQPVAEDTTAPSPPEETSAPEVEASEDAQPFDEKFDPTTLPPELQERYRQMQADYSRKTQTLAEQRKEAEQHAEAAELLERLQTDPDTQRALLRELAEALDYELPDDDEPDEIPESDDPVEALRQKLEALEAEKVAEKQQAAQEAHLARIDGHVTERLGAYAQAEGLEALPEDVESFIVSDAVSAFPPGKDGLPQVDAAVAKFKAMLDREVERKRQAYVESKQAQRPSESGQPGTEKFDITDRDARIARMTAVMEGGT